MSGHSDPLAPGMTQPGNASQSSDERWPSIDPHKAQMKRLQDFVKHQGDIAECILAILDFMESIQMNLPLFLWALSWNVPELISNDKA